MRLTYKIFLLLVAVLLAAGASSCRKGSINGDLDGQWQVMAIEYNDGSTVHPESTYYCLFLHTFNLTRTGYGTVSGNMIYEGDRLSLEAPYAEPAQLTAWGINSKVTDFRIMKLTGSRMTLKSDYALIDLRKF